MYPESKAPKMRAAPHEHTHTHTHKHTSSLRVMHATPHELHVSAQGLQELAHKLGCLQALVLQPLVGADLQAQAGRHAGRQVGRQALMQRLTLAPASVPLSLLYEQIWMRAYAWRAAPALRALPPAGCLPGPLSTALVTSALQDCALALRYAQGRRHAAMSLHQNTHACHQLGGAAPCYEAHRLRAPPTPQRTLTGCGQAHAAVVLLSARHMFASPLPKKYAPTECGQTRAGTAPAAGLSCLAAPSAWAPQNQHPCALGTAPASSCTHSAGSSCFWAQRRCTQEILQRTMEAHAGMQMYRQAWMADLPPTRQGANDLPPTFPLNKTASVLSHRASSGCLSVLSSSGCLSVLSHRASSGCLSVLSSSGCLSVLSSSGCLSVLSHRASSGCLPALIPISLA